MQGSNISHCAQNVKELSFLKGVKDANIIGLSLKT